VAKSHRGKNTENERDCGEAERDTDEAEEHGHGEGGLVDDALGGGRGRSERPLSQVNGMDHGAAKRTAGRLRGDLPKGGPRREGRRTPRREPPSGGAVLEGDS